MKTCAAVAVATCANSSNEVAHCQVLLPVVLDRQWYSSESDPPGNRRAWFPISLRSEIVVGVSNTPSQTAAFTPKCRASTVRIDCAAFTLMFTTEGGGTAVRLMSST